VDSVIVYTAIIGDIDDLLPGKGIAWVDVRKRRSPGWAIRQVKRQLTDPRRESRLYKILSHQWIPGTSIWIDGTIQLKVRPKELAQYLGENDMAAFRHPSNDCALREAEIVARAGKATEEALRQAERYRKAGFPEHYGMMACGVLVRRHTEATERFNDMWWSEYSRGCVRDQVSFNYVLWKTGMKCSIIPGDLYNNRFIKKVSHRNKGVSYS